MTTRDELREILSRASTIAVVGMSRDPYKAAYRVPACMVAAGFEVVPVNPFAEEIMGRRSYPSLLEVPGRIDIVEVFRPSAAALGVVQEALLRHEQRGDVELIWLQSGIFSAEGRALAAAAGVPYVEDRCMAVEVPRLFPGGQRPEACTAPDEEEDAAA
ncbi:MAG: CoA-binding protein [Anaerolineales bacterium]